MFVLNSVLRSLPLLRIRRSAYLDEFFGFLAFVRDSIGRFRVGRFIDPDLLVQLYRSILLDAIKDSLFSQDFHGTLGIDSAIEHSYKVVSTRQYKFDMMRHEDLCPRVSSQPKITDIRPYHRAAL